MQFSLLILGSPYSNQSVATALRFSQAAIKAGHNFYRIFFYHDGVYNANGLITPPQDEANIPQQWQLLADSHNIELILCIGSALKRGILDQDEASRFEKSSNNIHKSFEISGLGQLIDAANHSDRLITFGS